MDSGPDWHSEDIKAAIRKTGVTLTALAVAAGFSNSAVRVCLLRPIPRVQDVIAQHLRLRPQDIWPSRYDAAGKPRRGLRSGDRSEPSRSLPTPHRQKSEAA
jgi:Ner family transcriptional regulator